MTDVERTNIESYFENINNLIALKEALDKSLIYTRNEIDFAMCWLYDQYERYRTGKTNWNSSEIRISYSTCLYCSLRNDALNMSSSKQSYPSNKAN